MLANIRRGLKYLPVTTNALAFFGLVIRDKEETTFHNIDYRRFQSTDVISTASQGWDHLQVADSHRDPFSRDLKRPCQSPPRSETESRTGTSLPASRRHRRYPVRFNPRRRLPSFPARSTLWPGSGTHCRGLRLRPKTFPSGSSKKTGRCSTLSVSCRSFLST